MKILVYNIEYDTRDKCYTIDVYSALSSWLYSDQEEGPSMKEYEDNSMPKNIYLEIDEEDLENLDEFVIKEIKKKYNNSPTSFKVKIC